MTSREDRVSFSTQRVPCAINILSKSHVHVVNDIIKTRHRLIPHLLEGMA